MARDVDTTTFDPNDVPEVPEPKEKDPTGAFAGLPKLKATHVWKCRQCGYYPVDDKAGRCYNCGRNYFGEDGDVPSANEKPARAQVRSDGD
jgi:Predicted ATP-dependent serine protease